VELNRSLLPPVSGSRWQGLSLSVAGIDLREQIADPIDLVTGEILSGGAFEPSQESVQIFTAEP